MVSVVHQICFSASSFKENSPSTPFKIATVAAKKNKNYDSNYCHSSRKCQTSPIVISDPSKSFSEVSPGTQINYGTLLEFFHSRFGTAWFQVAGGPHQIITQGIVYEICFTAPRLLFPRADKNWIQMFVLNALFHALLLAFNPISLLSLLQKVLKSISDSQRKNTKAGLEFCTPCLSQPSPPQYFWLL